MGLEGVSPTHHGRLGRPQQAGAPPALAALLEALRVRGPHCQARSVLVMGGWLLGRGVGHTQVCVRKVLGCDGGAGGGGGGASLATPSALAVTLPPLSRPAHPQGPGGEAMGRTRKVSLPPAHLPTQLPAPPRHASLPRARLSVRYTNPTPPSTPTLLSLSFQGRWITSWWPTRSSDYSDRWVTWSSAWQRRRTLAAAVGTSGHSGEKAHL